MSVINITIVESSDQIVAGIPKTVTLSVNIASSIFYTLDGTTPTSFSNIYIGPIFLPTGALSVILSIFATNGTDSSPIIVETYSTNILNDARLPHSATDVPAGTETQDLFPFGDNQLHNGQYLNPGDAGINVDDPALLEISSGFDNNGNPNAFTNQPYTLENYSIRYSTTDVEGNTGPGIGNLPADVTIEVPDAPMEESQQFSNMFDPRALVIFQDFSKENPNDPPQINRQFFTLEDPERARDGNAFYNSGLDAPPVNGSFVRSHYNPRTGDITYYYLDTWTNRWIISTAPYKPQGTFNGNMASMVSAGGGAGGKYVYEWVSGRYRTLF